MRPERRRPARAQLAAALGLALAACLHFAGCDGGTSTGADNPDLILQVRRNGQVVEFNGFIQFFAENSNPDFFTAPADDGSSPPHVEIHNDPAATFILRGDNTIEIPARVLAGLVNAHPAFPLPKSSAAARAGGIPDFNVILTGFDSSTGLLTHIHMDSLSHRFSGMDGTQDTLIVSVSQGKHYAGTVDTATEAGVPIVLFVPGTSFFAPVHDGAFAFEDVPGSRMPLRWISANGNVHAMRDSLGATWTRPLRPGERIDSVSLPSAVPTLAPPEASPQGRFAFTDSVAVALTAQAGAAIYFTLDGKPPGPGSTRFTQPIVLRVNTTIMAVAYLKGWNHSAIAVNNYDLVPDLPVAAPAGQGFRDSMAVALSAKSKGAAIYYTLDGGSPSAAGAAKYAKPIVLKASATLKAVAREAGLGDSRVLEEKYILLTDSVVTPP